MNIYELEKQAAPGPWRVIDSNPMLIATSNGDVSGVPGDGTIDLHRAHAKLLAHCRNNFMAALEALKEIDRSCPLGGSTEAECDAFGRIKLLAREAIDELETV